MGRRSVARSLVPLAALLAGCSGSSDDGPNANLLVITLDTLRADHLGCYGAERQATPHLDAFAAQGVLFRNATTTAPLTLPSHSSLFTGDDPPVHGVRDNVGFTLPASRDTLAEALQARGWNTGAFVSAFVLDSSFGLDQGFETYADDIKIAQGSAISSEGIQRDGAETVDRALAWMEEQQNEAFFAWVHLFDPHTPYAAPAPFGERFADDPYLGEVAYTDDLVGRLLRGLEHLAVGERTQVWILGDHGESRGDHEEANHGIFLYDATTRIPMLVRAPGIEPRAVEAQVRLIDVMPTALDLLGVPLQGEPSGRSLRPLLTGEASDLELAAYAESLFPKLHYGWSSLRSLRTRRYKYIQAPRPELYDLEADPGERNNIVDRWPDVAADFRARLEAIEAGAERATDEARSQNVDAETVEALRALGYAGTTSPTTELDDSQLPDPKDKIGLLQEVSVAAHHIQSGAAAKGVELLRSLVEREPDMLDALITLGEGLFDLGAYEESVDVLGRAAELAPDLFSVWANLGLSLRGLGRDGDALRAFERARELAPSSVIPLGHLIDAYMSIGDFPQVETVCQQFLSLNPNNARVFGALGLAQLQQGKISMANQTVQRLLETDPAAERGNYLRAMILLQSNDLQGATVALEKELEHHQQNLDTFLLLASIYAQTGQSEQERRTLESAVQHHPGVFDAHLVLAQTYLRDGIKDPRAIEAARRALELNPESQAARAALEALQK